MGSTFNQRYKEPRAMKHLLITSAALALLMGTGVASAQTNETTTTTMQSPDSTTQTTVTKSQDANGKYTQYRKTVTSTRHYDAGAWVAPWTIVPATLCWATASRRIFWPITTTSRLGNYDLASPPEGTVWVRVGRDVFLVRSDNGEIIQADYGTFN